MEIFLYDVESLLLIKIRTDWQASVLDIFGFEVFKVNRFEQFCINYANEKLQLHFNHYNFMLERQLYLRESIELVESDFVDNSASVELIENRAWGLQATLDDICITPKGCAHYTNELQCSFAWLRFVHNGLLIGCFYRDDALFLQRLLQAKELKTHKNFQAPKQRNGSFIVHHYADSVTYTVDEFCEKNKDLLVADVVLMMQVSEY
jgi:myosin V